MDLVEAQTGRLGIERRHPWERARLAIVTDLIARHAALETGDTVLDVGCGDAFVIETLAARYGGVRFHGVDSALSASQLESIRASIPARNVSLSRSLGDVPAGGAKLVLLMDVIEHVPDDRGFLREVCDAAHADRDTRVLITVPAYPQLFSAHDRFLGHYRRYTRAMLRATLDAVRLDIVEDGQFFASLVPPRLWQLLRERVMGPPRQHGVGAWGGGETLGGAVASFLTLDGRLTMMLSRAGVPLPGLSVYAICRRSA